MKSVNVRAREMLEQLISVLVNSGRTKKIAEVEALIEEMKEQENYG